METKVISNGICPVCGTKEFLSYEYGTHAGNFDGSYHCDETYICSKCSGRIRVCKIAGKYGEVTSLKLEWEKYIPYPGSVTIA